MASSIPMHHPSEPHRVLSPRRPADQPLRRTVWPLMVGLVALVLGGLAGRHQCGMAADALAAEAGEPPVTLRVVWGGGRPRIWSGSIRVEGAVRQPAGLSADEVSGTGPAEERTGLSGWRLLSPDADALQRMHSTQQGITIHQQQPCVLDGVEVSVGNWRSARIVVDLVPDERLEEATHVEVAVSELINAPTQQALDADANRLSIKRAPGDELRLVLDGGAVRRPGETLRMEIHPLLSSRAPGATTVEFKVHIKSAPDGEEVFTRTMLLQEKTAPAASTNDAVVGRPAQEFGAVTVEMPLPAREGVWDISMEVVERGGLRWSRPLATRTLQVVTVTAAAAKPAPPEEWRAVYELDPASPRLMERLRRLPGMGRPATVAMPQVPMPALTLPKMSLSTAAMPRLPSVSAVVPRLTGLLSMGHSALESHPAGPMLRLTPARSVEEPSWEGIVIAGAQPGLPYAVEIEYPLDQQAVLGVTVLEQVGAEVKATFQGGFAVEGAVEPGTSGDSSPTAVGRHRCVFWPHTRTPLLLVSNASPRTAALFGRVSILAGPTQLAPLPDGVAQPPHARRIYAYIPDPEFSGFGGSLRVDPATGRTVADWQTFLAGARTQAAWLAAQGAAGAMVGVYGDGGAIWPSALTHAAPRWDSGGSFEAALDPAPKDVLQVVCRVYERQGLRLVPAITCNGPLAQVEKQLHEAPTETDGLFCIGRDGRPGRGEPGASGRRYNILDPRVQEAVAELVAELADRVSDSPAVDGLALVMPHDGWLHLPGVAWGLDDVTFARFLEAAGPATADLAKATLAQSGPEQRFALRANLVEGVLREPWLAWRVGVVARFHARLADMLAQRNPTWTLSVVPTTLFSVGDLAARFRPVLNTEPSDAGLYREIGIDPQQLTTHPQVVFVAPHVHGAMVDMVERSSLQAANKSIATAAAAVPVGRRAVVAVEIPGELDLRTVMPHGPFGSAAAPAAVRVHTARMGAAHRRLLTEALVQGDAETAYDMGLLFQRVMPESQREARAFQSMLPQPMPRVEAADVPLIVRAAMGSEGLRVVVANACTAPCRVMLSFKGTPTGILDAVDRRSVALDPSGTATLKLAPWEARTLVVAGVQQVATSKVSFEPAVGQAIRNQLDGLRRRRSSLELPVPLAVLDNPSFELPENGGAIPGWDLLEPQRGRLTLVGGSPQGGARGAGLSSTNGLATLRSNPFPSPATGRISIAVWLRVADGEGQPPLRIALEGVQNDREYYRFAPVGRGENAMPLGPQWSQFVLQVDDLPTQGVESLRVRLDLLSGGSVQIDDVRVFDLAFDESQRVQLSKMLALVDHHLAAGEWGACLGELDTHWPEFLRAFVPAASSPAAVADAPPPAGQNAGLEKAAPQPAPRTSVLERVRRWWQ